MVVISGAIADDVQLGPSYPSSEGGLFVEDLVVKIEGPEGTVIVSA
jgi:hypothetical protein